MKLKLLSKGENVIELLIEGEDHSLPNALVSTLLEDDDVEFASYVMDHPEVGQPKLVVRTKRGKPGKALADAVKKLAKQAAAFRSAFEKAK